MLILNNIRLMKPAITLIFIFFFFVFHAQSTKTLNDSLFKKGDIIKIPKILYGLSHPLGGPFTTDSIKPIAAFLKKHKNLVVEIGCHTDSRGDDKKNILLSVHRVKYVFNCLIYECKIDSIQLKYKGYGETKPIIPEKIIKAAKSKEEKEKLYQLNRRTELIVLEVN